MYFRFLFIFSLLFLSSCGLTEKSESSSSGSGETYVTNLSDEERVALAKKRRSYITGIRKGDFYSLRNAPDEALSYYLSVQEKIPDDQVVRKKTAHVYFIMKNWSRAYAEYILVPASERNAEDMHQMLSALFFDEDTFDRLGELPKLGISTGMLEYHEMIDTCYTTIHDCIVHIEAYTGSEALLTDLQAQIKKAEKISPDYQYRNLLVAAKFYEQGMYRASETILRQMLKERPDYLEVKKMLGFALSELGKYNDARKYLLEYLDANPRDMDTIVALGELYFHIGDYVSSNLYLNNAIIVGYTPKTNLERRLAYNYSLLSDTVGMMKVMNYLLQEPDATEDDFTVALSSAISLSDLARAISWAQQGLKLYPDSHKIHPLYIQALRLSGDIDNASALLQNTPESAMIENPNYLLEKAIILYDLSDRESAKKIFLDITELSDWPELAEEARIYIARIEADVSVTP